MSQAHLLHKISWNQLSECCRTPDKSTIYLPVGACGLIHPNKKSVEIQINNRKYINDEDICTDNECEIVRYKRFGKKPLQEPVMCTERSKYWKDEIEDKLEYFCKTFYGAIVEFAETEEKRVIDDRNVPTEDDLKELKSKLANPYYWGDNDGIVLALFLNHDLNNLLSLHSKGRINIVEALQKTYGGQAVGNGYRFLMYYLFQFYLTANMIIYLNLQDDPKKWGSLNPEKYSYQTMLSDCDFLTFIPHLRYILKDGLLFKDYEKTQMLLKEIFRYIYNYVFLCKKTGYVNDYKYFYDDIKTEVSYAFRL